MTCHKGPYSVGIFLKMLRTAFRWRKLSVCSIAAILEFQSDLVIKRGKISIHFLHDILRKSLRRPNCLIIILYHRFQVITETIIITAQPGIFCLKLLQKCLLLLWIVRNHVLFKMLLHILHNILNKCILCLFP